MFLQPALQIVILMRVYPHHKGEKIRFQKNSEKLLGSASTMSIFDPCKNQCKSEVQRIINLQKHANQLPYAFIDTKKVTKSHIPTVNALA